MLHFCIFENDLPFVSPPIDLNLKKYYQVLTCVYLKMKYKFHFQNANIIFTFEFN